MIKHGVEFASAQVILKDSALWLPYSLQCSHGVVFFILVFVLTLIFVLVFSVVIIAVVVRLRKIE